MNAYSARDFEPYQRLWAAALREQLRVACFETHSFERDRARIVLTRGKHVEKTVMLCGGSADLAKSVRRRVDEIKEAGWPLGSQF